MLPSQGRRYRCLVQRLKRFDIFPPDWGMLRRSRRVLFFLFKILLEKKNSLGMEMSRLRRDGTAEPVSRDQMLRREQGQGNVNFLCSADHEQDWQPYSVDPYSPICYDHTYIRTYIHTYNKCRIFSRSYQSQVQYIRNENDVQVHSTNILGRLFSVLPGSLLVAPTWACL